MGDRLKEHQIYVTTSEHYEYGLVTQEIFRVELLGWEYKHHTVVIDDHNHYSFFVVFSRDKKAEVVDVKPAVRNCFYDYIGLEFRQHVWQCVVCKHNHRGSHQGKPPPKRVCDKG